MEKIMLLDVDKFKRIMVTKGYSRRGLAKKVGVSGTTITQIISQVRNPGPATAKGICKALDVEFEEIFFISSDNNSYRVI